MFNNGATIASAVFVSVVKSAPIFWSAIRSAPVSSFRPRNRGRSPPPYPIFELSSAGEVQAYECIVDRKVA